MPDPLVERDQLGVALEFAAAAARRYLERVRDEPVLRPDTEAAVGRWSDPRGRARLLQVLLDRIRVPCLRFIGILSGFPAGTSLAQ